MKTKHEEIENRLNTVRAEIFDEFKRLIKLHSITSKTKIEADFIICISPNEYDPIGIEYCEKRDEIIVILKNTNDGSETNEMIRFLNTDDILSLLYWFTDALIVVHDKR
jgi:hypothetical protein